MQVNDHDNDLKVLARAEQEDAWAMYLALEASSSAPPTLGCALRLAARGCLQLAESDLARAEHADAFAAWHAESFRKIAVRAHKARWRKLQTVSGLVVSEQDVQLRALVPMRKSQRSRPVLDAQAMTLELDAPTQAPDHARTALLALNPAVTMSSGKAMAQVGHAAMMLHAAMDDDARAQWAADSHRLQVVVPSAQTWQRALEHPASWGVRDAGLTEVQAGTLTVVAVPAGALELSAADRALV